MARRRIVYIEVLSFSDNLLYIVLVQPQSHPSTIFRSYGASGVNEDTKILKGFIISYEQQKVISVNFFGN